MASSTHPKTCGEEIPRERLEKRVKVKNERAHNSYRMTRNKAAIEDEDYYLEDEDFFFEEVRVHIYSAVTLPNLSFLGRRIPHHES
jgi:hypothetical protein